MRAGRLVVAIALSVALLAPHLAPPASAHHDGTQYFGSSYAHICDRTPASQCVADDRTHYYSFDPGLIDIRRTATTRALNTYGVNSVINVVAQPGDVYVLQQTRTDVNAFAWTQCAPTPNTVVYGGSDAAHTRWCRPQWIYWNTRSDAVSKVNTFARYNYIGCHEVGHTLGLRHRGTSPSTCMVTAALPPSNPDSVVPSVQDPTIAEMTRLNDHYTP